MSVNIRARYVDKGYWRLIFMDGTEAYEHRWLMQRRLGRVLKRSEHVHHKNGNRKDNRLDNLEILTASEHSLQHARPCPMETVTCATCHAPFSRPARFFRFRRARGQAEFYCGRRCLPGSPPHRRGTGRYI